MYLWVLSMSLFMSTTIISYFYILGLVSGDVKTWIAYTFYDLYWSAYLMSNSLTFIFRPLLLKSCIFIFRLLLTYFTDHTALRNIFSITYKFLPAMITLHFFIFPIFSIVLKFSSPNTAFLLHISHLVPSSPQLASTWIQ